MKGSYILIINVPDDEEIYIGSLGKLLFKRGDYLYIGSAMGNYGSSTLLNRVNRHIQPSENKKIHWHIDYLLKQKNTYISRIYLIPSVERLECNIAKELKTTTENYISNFGSTDCDCPSHLFYIKEFKDLGNSNIIK